MEGRESLHGLGRGRPGGDEAVSPSRADASVENPMGEHNETCTAELNEIEVLTLDSVIAQSNAIKVSDLKPERETESQSQNSETISNAKVSEHDTERGTYDAPPERSIIEQKDLADMSILDMARHSSLFMTEGIAQNSHFAKEMSTCSRIPAERKRQLLDTMSRLVDIICEQNTWFSFLAGKTSQSKPVSEEEPAVDIADPQVPRHKLRAASASQKSHASKRKSREEKRLGKKPESSTNAAEDTVEKEAAPKPSYSDLVRSEGEWKVAKGSKKKKKRPKQGESQSSSQTAEVVNAGTEIDPVKRTDAQRARRPRIRKPAKEFILLVRPRDANTSSEDTRKMLTSAVNVVDLGIALRGTRRIDRGGLLISADSQDDLEKLETAIAASALVDKVVAARPAKRDPEFIIFGVDESLPAGEIVPAILKQNETLSGVSLTLRTVFQGKRGRNAVVSVGSEHCTRMQGVRKLKVGWCIADVRDSRRPLICFRCWKYGHTQKVCRSGPRCGGCGKGDHVLKDCKAPASCPNCTYMNQKYNSGFSTAHAAGSQECDVFKKEVARVLQRQNGQK